MMNQNQQATNLPIDRKMLLSIREAAEYSNTPYRTWQDWEGGKRRVPGIAGAWLRLWAERNTGA